MGGQYLHFRLHVTFQCGRLFFFCAAFAYFDLFNFLRSDLNCNGWFDVPCGNILGWRLSSFLHGCFTSSFLFIFEAFLVLVGIHLGVLPHGIRLLLEFLIAAPFNNKNNDDHQNTDPNDDTEHDAHGLNYLGCADRRLSLVLIHCRGNRSFIGRIGPVVVSRYSVVAKVFLEIANIIVIRIPSPVIRLSIEAELYLPPVRHSVPVSIGTIRDELDHHPFLGEIVLAVRNPDGHVHVTSVPVRRVPEIAPLPLQITGCDVQSRLPVHGEFDPFHLDVVGCGAVDPYFIPHKDRLDHLIDGQ